MVSFVITQKLPSSHGSRSPIVLIGRPRMTELSEYSCHDCIVRSAKITIPTSRTVIAPTRAEQTLVVATEHVPDADTHEHGHDPEPEEQPQVHALTVEDGLQREPQHHADACGRERAVQRLAVPGAGHHGGDPVRDSAGEDRQYDRSEAGVEHPLGGRDVRDDATHREAGDGVEHEEREPPIARNDGQLHASFLCIIGV